MAQSKIRGLRAEQELNEEYLYRDTRSFVTKAAAWLRVPNNMAMLLIMFAAVVFLFPGLGDIALILGSLLLCWGMRQREECPIKMPIQSGLPDPNQIHPGNGKPVKAEGIFFLGNELATGKEIWLTNDDCRQHFLILGTTGAGKALPDDALVHTVRGWRRMEEIRVGERLSMPDGTSAWVDGVYPQGDLDIYQVTFADGRVAEACPEHLWEVADETPGRKSRARKPRLMRTLEIKELLESGASGLTIRLPEPVEKPGVDLGVDPYRLGTLIGVGDSYNLMEGTRKAGTLPDSCLEGTVGQRWALVQGMMDANGTVLEDGSLFYPTVGEGMAKSLQQLVWSLGGFAKVVCGPHAVESEQGLVQADEPFWYVNVLHPSPDLFFSRPDKVARVERLAPRRPIRLGIVNVEFVRRAPATCIHVDHPDHLFITNDYVVTHNTETLLGFGANAMSWGSGFLFCDGKGDVQLFAKIYAMARRFGREDDLLVLNFMTGNQDLGAGNGKVRSNTLNPFATGSSDNLTQMVVGLMDDAGGDGAMWQGRATAMFTGVMRALGWMRDQHIIDLNVSEIRDHLSLKRIIDLADQSKFPEMRPDIRKSIKSYLSSLPGYQEEKGYKQSQTTLDQHGYLEMQFTKILGSLVDVYGYIFHTPYGEVDMHDVVLGRRILVIMLPALEKSGPEIANLGKIVVATLKGMMGSTLGSQIEGNWEEIVEKRPTNSPSPFICILDEVGYYTVEGMALMAAQARSLGFSMVYASQDIPAMLRLNDKEAKSIVANTNTKILMRTEEAAETGKLGVESGGKGMRSQVGGYAGESTEAGVAYRDTMDARIEAVDRVNFTDLKSQGSGQMHVLFADKVVRAKSFFANPESAVDKRKLRLRTNHFIKVAKPSAEAMESASRMPEMMARLIDPDFCRELEDDAQVALANLEDAAEAKDEIALAAVTFDKVVARTKRPLDAACAAIANVVKTQQGVTQAFVSGVKSATSPRGIVAPVKSATGFSAITGAARRPPPRHVGPPEMMPDDLGPPSFNLDDDLEYDDPPASDDQGSGTIGGRRSEGVEPERRLSALRNDVRHGATIDDGAIIDMADHLASNEKVLRALAELDFDGNETTREQVQASLTAAAADTDDDFDMFDQDAFDRDAIEAAAHEADIATDAEPVESGGSTEDDSTLQFLTSLLGEEEEDED